MLLVTLVQVKHGAQRAADRLSKCGIGCVFWLRATEELSMHQLLTIVVDPILKLLDRGLEAELGRSFDDAWAKLRGVESGGSGGSGSRGQIQAEAAAGGTDGPASRHRAHAAAAPPARVANHPDPSPATVGPEAVPLPGQGPARRGAPRTPSAISWGGK